MNQQFLFIFLGAGEKSNKLMTEQSKGSTLGIEKQFSGRLGFIMTGLIGKVLGFFLSQIKYRRRIDEEAMHSVDAEK